MLRHVYETLYRTEGAQSVSVEVMIIQGGELRGDLTETDGCGSAVWLNP